MKHFTQNNLRKMIGSLMIIKGHYDVKCMFSNCEKAQQINDKLLLKIIRENRNSEYGKKYHFDKIENIEQFKKNVPIVKYEDIADDVDRMYFQNQENILTSKKIIGYATSSGSVGKPKYIPRTNKDIKIYTKYTVTRFLALAHQFYKKQHIRFKPARGICTLCQHNELSPFGLVSTNVADIAAKKYYFIYPYILNLPLKRQFSADEIDIRYANLRFALEDKDCLFLFSVFAKNIDELFDYLKHNWKMLVHDIETGTIDSSIRIKPEIYEQLSQIIKPNKQRAAELKIQFEKGFDETLTKRLWPNLRVISAIGTSSSFEGFVSSIKQYTADIAFDYSIYGASEGLFAAAFQSDNPGQVMLADSCYYEFVQVDDEQENEITETLQMNQLEVGKNYEIILTNQSGFYRYRINDIVKVLGYQGQSPIINFLYRRGQLLNINGEKTTLQQMNAVIKMLEEKSNIKILHWATTVELAQQQYRYVLLVETENNISLKEYQDYFQECLCEVNTAYRYYQEKKKLIDPPVIYNLKQFTNDNWVNYKVKMGASEEQIKPVRILDTEEKQKFFLKAIIK